MIPNLEHSFDYKYVYLVLNVISTAISVPIYFFGEFTLANIFLLLSTFMITAFASSRNILHISVLSGHYAFWVMPIIVTTYIGIEINYHVSLWSVLGVTYLIIGTMSCPQISWNKYEFSVSSLVYIILYMVAFVAMFVSSGYTFVPFIGIIIVAGALRMSGGGGLVSISIYCSIFVYTAFYWLLYWNGSGRLVVMGIFMTITFMYLMRMGLAFVLKPIVMFFIPLGTLGGTLLRFGGDGLGDAIFLATKDSTLSPIVLSSEIFNARGYAEIVDFFGWVDQVLLLFLAFVPRVVWPSKPNGFGTVYTLENLPQYLADAGHSVAANFFGEHVYYLGSVGGVFGMFFALSVIILTYRFLSSDRILGGYSSFIMGLWLPTYYWGGMQSFSARFLISFIPVVFLLLLYRIYIRSRGRKINGARAKFYRIARLSTQKPTGRPVFKSTSKAQGRSRV